MIVDRILFCSLQRLAEGHVPVAAFLSIRGFSELGAVLGITSVTMNNGISAAGGEKACSVLLASITS